MSEGNFSYPSQSDKLVDCNSYTSRCYTVYTETCKYMEVDIYQVGGVGHKNEPR